jgi:3,4-dihydroxy 2-butanone 4-phosphate synthase/GTP cyclohydrolase II
MRVITNNPAKYGGLEGFGLDITARVPSIIAPNPENIAYLRTKRDRMGHLLEGLDEVAEGAAPTPPAQLDTASGEEV